MQPASARLAKRKPNAAHRGVKTPEIRTGFMLTGCISTTTISTASYRSRQLRWHKPPAAAVQNAAQAPTRVPPDPVYRSYNEYVDLPAPFLSS